MKKVFSIMISILYLNKGTHATEVLNSSPPPSVTVSSAHKAIMHQSTIKDRAGNNWKVYSTLTADQMRRIHRLGSLALTSANLSPVVVSPETLSNFFLGCPDIAGQDPNQATIGLRFLYPATIQTIIGYDASNQSSSTAHSVFLTRTIPRSEASRYRSSASFTEMDQAWMQMMTHLLKTNADLNKLTRLNFTQELKRAIEVTFIISLATTYIFVATNILPTWVLALSSYPIILILQTLFLPTGIFTTLVQN